MTNEPLTLVNTHTVSNHKDKKNSKYNSNNIEIQPALQLNANQQNTHYEPIHLLQTVNITYGLQMKSTNSSYKPNNKNIQLRTRTFYQTKRF